MARLRGKALIEWRRREGIIILNFLNNSVSRLWFKTKPLLHTRAVAEECRRAGYSPRQYRASPETIRFIHMQQIEAKVSPIAKE